jgi:hypothetical protein
MEPMTLDGRLGTSVSVDICRSCEAFWFDAYESVRLAPAATLALVQSISSTSGGSGGPLSTSDLRCPRCGTPLTHTHDLQGTTPFQYWRCDKGHGRFTTFVDFLREKSFLRPLTAEERAEVRQAVGTINCTNCGAPIDIARSSTCSHCGTALSMADVARWLKAT